MEIPPIWAVLAALGFAGALMRIRHLSIRLREADLTLRKEQVASHNKDEAMAIQDRNNKKLARLLRDKSDAMPWVAKMVADILWVQDNRDARRPETKKHPAPAAAKTVRKHAQEKSGSASRNVWLITDWRSWKASFMEPSRALTTLGATY